MATLIVTKNKGGMGRSAAMTVVPPSQEVPLQALRAIGPGAKLDGVALADILSAITMHERASVRFARAAAQQTNIPELRELHEALADGHGAHVATLESLMTSLGVPPLYASPSSRMAGFLAESLTQSSLLGGSVGSDALEFTRVDVALTLAEKCLADARALEAIAAQVQPPRISRALTAAVRAMTADTSVLERLRSVRQACLVAAVTKG